MSKQHLVEWRDARAEPRCPPDPRYPAGIDLDLTRGHSPSCKVALPYPAKRIGAYVIQCELCGIRVSCTTAGRCDDPRSITIPCKLYGSGNNTR
jgi:hypothetical protein